jgi:transposase
VNISSEEKLRLERRAKQTKDKHEHTRLCVILARSEGMSHELIAQVLRISVSSVYQYIMDYEKENKTQHDTRGGSVSKLNESQLKELIEHLETVTYLSAKEICNYVRKTYGVEYTTPGMTYWLKEHGFVYKAPVSVPGKLSVEKQEAFIEKYEELKANLPADEKIYFIDAVHPAHQSQSACGWIKKGEVKTLPTTNKQKLVHIIGVLALDGMEIITQEYSTINGQNMISFLKHLESICSAFRIHIISDNGRANKNKEIEEYLKTSRIEIHYLPPYSPNLNAIERLWKVMRELKTYNRCYGSFAEFTEAIRNFFFKDIPKIGDLLKQRINDKFQRIKLNHVVFPTT